MHRSKIEWVLNPDNKTLGWVWNPITGCLNGCQYCYARKLANGRLRERYCKGTVLARTERSNYSPDRENQYDDPFWPRFWPEKLNNIYRPKLSKAKPRGIFVCDMSDLFGIGVPEEWTRRILDAIRNDPIDRFYLLTKRYEQLERWSPFPDNCWVGVSCENEFDLFRHSSALGNIEAKVRFISFEPLLRWRGLDRLTEVLRDVARIQWVIIGAVTKCPELPQPKVEWVREIVGAADKAGVKVFLKNNLRIILPYEKWCYNHEPPQIWKLRQEMPFPGIDIALGYMLAYPAFTLKE